MTTELRYYTESGSAHEDKVVFGFTVDVEAFVGSKMPPREWMEAAIRIALEQNDHFDVTTVTVGRDE